MELRQKLIAASKKLRHRGPDWSGFVIVKNTGIAHERLAIIDPDSGAQPITSIDDSVIVAANGEIYNYKELYASLETPYTPKTGSDCEVVIPLFKQHGIENFISMLRGMFGIIMYDKVVTPPSVPNPNRRRMNGNEMGELHKLQYYKRS